MEEIAIIDAQLPQSAAATGSSAANGGNALLSGLSFLNMLNLALDAPGTSGQASIQPESQPASDSESLSLLAKPEGVSGRTTLAGQDNTRGKTGDGLLTVVASWIMSLLAAADSSSLYGGTVQPQALANEDGQKKETTSSLDGSDGQPPILPVLTLPVTPRAVLAEDPTPSPVTVAAFTLTNSATVPVAMKADKGTPAQVDTGRYVVDAAKQASSRTALKFSDYSEATEKSGTAETVLSGKEAFSAAAVGTPQAEKASVKDTATAAQHSARETLVNVANGHTNQDILQKVDQALNPKATSGGEGSSTVSQPAKGGQDITTAVSLAEFTKDHADSGAGSKDRQAEEKLLKVEQSVRHDVIAPMSEQQTAINHEAAAGESREAVQVVQTGGDRIVLVRKDGTSIEVSLKVEGMGKLDIAVMIDKGSLSAQISTSDVLGRQLLENNLRHLVDTLSQGGLNIGNVSVSVRDQSQFSHGDQQGWQARDEGISVIGNPKAVPLRAEQTGIVSIFV